MECSDRLRVEVLGPLGIWRDGAKISPGKPRQCAVFAALAMRAGRSVTSAELIAAVWGDDQPASVEGNLHTYVSGLRRALDPTRAHRKSASLLASDATGYTLHLEPSDVDAMVFEQACENAARVDDFESIVEILDDALALWRGDALSGVPGPFAESERERLAQLRLTAVELRAKAVLALGGHRELSAELTGLVREHPLRESLRELLMLALYRGGRHTEALEVFRDARRILVQELGVEPGAGLRRLHEQVLEFDPVLDLPATPARSLISALPLPANRIVEHGTTGSFVGRAAEVERLRGRLAEVAGGRGGVVWVEGEPGIGKTELLTVSLAGAGARGCQVAWGTCDEISSRIPLEVLKNCLGIGPGATATGEEPVGWGWAHGDPGLSAADNLMSLVDELCAGAPLVLVVDNLQWIDDASLRVWRRLTVASRHLPLLLVVACRSVADNVDLLRLRDRMDAGGGELVRLDPLSDMDTKVLVAGIVGAEPGPRLVSMVARASGNPFYITKLLHVLATCGAIKLEEGVADVVSRVKFETPLPLLDAVDRLLDGLAEETRAVLDSAALLGVEFAVADVATVMGRQAVELVPAFEDALAANLLADAGDHLLFRHSLVHEAFYKRSCGSARDASHVRVAKALADAGAPVRRVAQQLAAARSESPLWMAEWLAEHHAALANRAPLIAVDLLERAVEHAPRDCPLRQVLLTVLVRVLFRLGRDPEELARGALDEVTDPAQAADIRELLAVMLHRRGETAAAVEVVEPWLDDPGVPEIWRTRHRQLLANLRRGGLDDLPTMARLAHETLASAEGDDPYRTAQAHETLWLVRSVQRDYRQALTHIDRALTEVRDRAELALMHLDLLDKRMFACHNLDALADAGRTLAEARTVAANHSVAFCLQVSAAVHHYWTGQWDDALVELDVVAEDHPAITFHGLREPGARLILSYGVAALIAARRDDDSQAATHLEAAEERAPATMSERDSVDFLLVAHSTMAERDGDLERALRTLMPLLDPGYGKTLLRHQWLPRIVRLAMAAGHPELANQTMAVCVGEAAKEVPPARAFAAAEWCRGLVLADSTRVLRAAQHYRKTARRMELASALEDAAVLLGAAGDAENAATTLNSSLEIYTELAARWDIRRAEARLAGLGVSRAVRPTEPRTDPGWESLSPLEVQIATLVAAGYSNPAIAGQLALPRHNIQTHVASVLSKLEGLSRKDFPDENRRQDTR